MLTEQINLLDIMIENARRLCVRSPILFRMSTRKHIISSKNTRYGVDQGTMFQTWTTSSGIKNIISLSAAYFNSLSSTGDTDRSQEMIRPRFLQMLVLLLALLNDDDLKDIAEFLVSTYKIRAERQHLELMFLKVLPLMSINSKVFLNAMVTAFEGPFVNPSPHPEDAPKVWHMFVERLLQYNYIIPGTVNQLGDPDLSWVVRWPDNGIKDSHVFCNLQYAGKERTVNEIPPINLNLALTDAELTVILTNGEKFLVIGRELENIIRMTKGKYSVTQVEGGCRTFDLDITETVVSDQVARAISRMNQTLTVLNGFLAAPRRREGLGRVVLRRDRRPELMPFADIKGSGRLTMHQANLNDQVLAIAYKVEGRKITRRDLLRNLGSDLRKLRSMLHHVETSMMAFFEGRRIAGDMRQNLNSLRQSLSEVADLVARAEDTKGRLETHLPDLGDEPVAKVLYPTGTELPANSVWHDYQAWYIKRDNLLYMDAQRRVVEKVAWISDSIAELQFYGQPTKYFVSPLVPVAEDERWEEVKQNDHAVLVGQYVAVVEAGEAGEGQPPEVMTNWLKITGVEQQFASRREANRRRGPSTVVRTVVR